MKQSGLRFDPSKVRAWQDRSRAPLKQDPAKGLKRSGFKQVVPPAQRARNGLRADGTSLPTPSTRDAQGREGMRSTKTRRAAGLEPHEETLVEAVSESPPELTMQKALATRFQARVRASGEVCFKCGGGAHAWHHWVPQEHLRVWMRGLAREAGWSPKETRRRLRRWLQDERNLSAVCTDCHGNTTTTHAQEFSRADVPLSAFSFATAVDDELEAAGRPREAMVRLLGSYA